MKSVNVKLVSCGLVLVAAGAFGCGSDPGTEAGEPTATLDSAAKIEGFLEGRALVMKGDDIPTHPMGLPRDANLAQATQCYSEVDMSLMGATFDVKSKMGTLKDAPNPGDVGTCDIMTVSTELEFSSTTHVIESIEGDAECFDFTISYPGFGQEGRGAISEDRTKLELELYFKDKATGIGCADGKPGASGVMLADAMGNSAAFDGDAVQVYRIEE